MVLRAAIVVLLAALAVNADDGAVGCTVNGKTVKVGEQYDVPGHCNLNVCKGNNEFSTASCGLLGQPPGWEYIPENTSQPYPECCGRVIPPFKIVPDVIDDNPGIEYLEVNYDSNVTAEYGNELTPTQVKNAPEIKYSGNNNSFYLLCMTDPDASKEFVHWLVGNIPGEDIASGEVLRQYVGSGPPKGTGLHRYVFLLYEQPKKLTFDEAKETTPSIGFRSGFSIRKFAAKYKLGNPIAFNLYRAQYDDYVPEVHKKLGKKD